MTQFALPVFLNCIKEGESSLPGCLFKFDSLDEQCHEGRKGWKHADHGYVCKTIVLCICNILGDLCSQCKGGYGISLDLRRCVKDDTCGAVGVTIFVLTCKILL